MLFTNVILVSVLQFMLLCPKLGFSAKPFIEKTCFSLKKSMSVAAPISQSS